tara:strand:+ start:6185 stop:6385 length:201 start_codon:yes stop_codon:yes gene_type:complete
MTEKEKAKELIEKFDETLTYLESKSKAKQCALICVNETIEALRHNEWQNMDWIVYYEGVKIEIEKL